MDLSVTRVREISELVAAPSSSPWKARAVRSLPIPFDKNTSRNQITHHPTYRRFPINVEEPRCRKSTAGERERERRRQRRERERRRDDVIWFFSIEKSAFREDLQRAGIAFYAREKADNIDIREQSK